MTTIDTLNPEEIRRLPVRRDLPLNGLTEPQIRAIGLDPAEVETARVAQLEWEKANRLQGEARLVLAAQQAVENGDLTSAEAAMAVRRSGGQTAHDLFVQEWAASEQAEEAEFNAESEATDLIWADAAEYLQKTGKIDEADAAKAAADAAAAKATEDARLAEQIKARLDATVPEGHPLREGIEAALVLKINEDGGAPSDDLGQSKLISAAVQKTAVLDAATESIRQQADQEWRILRKTQGKSDGLTTAADIESARAHYINARLQQLGDRKMIDHDDLKAPPTAEEEQARWVDRIGARNSRSTSLHEAIGDIATRGREAEEARRAGVSAWGNASDKERYRESVRKAEENARVGVAPNAADAVVSRNPDRPDLPADWADEYGRAGYSAP